LWGLYFAIWLAVEKYLLARWLERAPRIVGHIYLLIIILCSWILFESPDLATSAIILQSLFGMGGDGLAGAASLYYLQSFAVIIVVGAIGCTPLPATIARRVSCRRSSPLRSGELSAKQTARPAPEYLGRALRFAQNSPHRWESFGLFTILEPLFLLVILVVVTAFLVDGSFNPFIYFRF
jgi:alginate O-acetyltransferase complex protein AlgI